MSHPIQREGPIVTSTGSTTHPLLEVRDGQLLRDGQPHQIISGALHYFRVHPDLWEDRLRRIRAMGLNTVETYLAWNFHEIRDGVFDFTGPRDVARFTRIAADLGLDVILRPGPYICAEWDFGGLPARLMNKAEMTLRASDPDFLAEVDGWLDAVVPQMLPLLATNGGPVVMVQVENEYGSWGNDRDYLHACKNALLSRGVDVLLVTSDGGSADWLEGGTIEGVWATANFGSRVTEGLDALKEARPNDPTMVMEYWNGWFDHWGQPHHTRDAKDAAACLAEILEANASVNLYMAHGGTNFGLWNGANFEEGKLRPTVTSYDYDAPVAEAGELTEKFDAYRAVIQRHTGVQAPAAPAPLPRVTPTTVELSQGVALMDVLDSFPLRASSIHPMPMERLGVDRGLAVYRTSTVLHAPGTLILDDLADRATVLVNGEYVATIDRDDAEYALPLEPAENLRIGLIVENKGRINFGPRVGERKGVGSVRVDLRLLHGWEAIGLPLDADGFTSLIPFPTAEGAADSHRKSDGPFFARTTVDLDAPGDAFLALPGWGKGFVWLNGTLLGRYWEVGPQATLYAPMPLWHSGTNEIVVLEMLHRGSDLEVRDQPELGRG